MTKMQVKERNRLIKLIMECSTFTPEYEEQAKLHASYVADHLMRAGVLTPPLKIGDTVYSIKDSVLFIHSIEVTDVQFNKYGYDFIAITKNGTYKFFEDDDIGETYFFTLEEAEKALEERNRRKQCWLRKI